METACFFVNGIAKKFVDLKLGDKIAPHITFLVCWGVCVCTGMCICFCLCVVVKSFLLNIPHFPGLCKGQLIKPRGLRGLRHLTVSYLLVNHETYFIPKEIQEVEKYFPAINKSECRAS